jgi:neuronal cell adhesion molecule
MVVKAELNSFNNEPNIYINAQEGEPFKLTCHPPTGWPKPIVNWLKKVDANSSVIYYKRAY